MSYSPGITSVISLLLLITTTVDGTLTPKIQSADAGSAANQTGEKMQSEMTNATQELNLQQTKQVKKDSLC